MIAVTDIAGNTKLTKITDLNNNRLEIKLIDENDKIYTLKNVIEDKHYTIIKNIIPTEVTFCDIGYGYYTKSIVFPLNCEDISEDFVIYIMDLLYGTTCLHYKKNITVWLNDTPHQCDLNVPKQDSDYCTVKNLICEIISFLDALKDERCICISVS